jgi:hypothetical protein
MATTWIKPIHKSKNKSVVATLSDSIGYADNPAKTGNFEYVKSYGCDYYTAANEFALAKRMYEQRTGRRRDKGDIIAYHLRQSFKPGEIEPGEALEIGYALAEKFTHGRHAFVVAVHTDKQHTHCHCIFSAVNMDCDKKFRNPMRSMKIVRQISDHLCVEHGLSIVENPQPSKGSYADWLDKKEPASNKEKLRGLIDSHPPAGMVFEQFIAAMQSSGCEVKRGKYLAFKIPGAKRFIRVKSLGEDYTEEALRERCSGKRTIAPRLTGDKPNMLIDIERKMAEGKGAGYEQWAKIFNVKTMSKTLIFLQRNNLTDIYKLRARTSDAENREHELGRRLKTFEARQKEISELQKTIGTYTKSRDVYRQYICIKIPKDKAAFYEANRADITLHQTAKKYFNEHGYNRENPLPKMDALKHEWASLEAERRKLYSEYRTARDEMKELYAAKYNAEKFLGYTAPTPEEIERQRQRSHVQSR